MAQQAKAALALLEAVPRDTLAICTFVLPIRDHGLPEGRALTGRSMLFSVPTRPISAALPARVVHGRPSHAAFHLFRRQKGCGASRARLSPFFAFSADTGLRFAQGTGRDRPEHVV